MDCIYRYDFGDEYVLGSKIYITRSSDSYTILFEQESDNPNYFRDIKPIQSIHTRHVIDDHSYPSPDLKLFKRTITLELNRLSIHNNPAPEKLFKLI